MLASARHARCVDDRMRCFVGVFCRAADISALSRPVDKLWVFWWIWGRVGQLLYDTSWLWVVAPGNSWLCWFGTNPHEIRRKGDRLRVTVLTTAAIAGPNDCRKRKLG